MRNKIEFEEVRNGNNFPFNHKGSTYREAVILKINFSAFVNQYAFYSTGQKFKIKSHITCETSNVIYMIQCTKCNLQYIGETKRRFKDRFNEHRRPIINPFCSYTHTAVSRHFLTSGHAAEDHLILIPLEQLHISPDSIRKDREAFLIHRGKTLEPAGLNRRDEM